MKNKPDRNQNISIEKCSLSTSELPEIDQNKMLSGIFVLYSIPEKSSLKYMNMPGLITWWDGECPRLMWFGLLK